MPKSNGPSRAQAIRQALEQADKPLSFDQLLAATRKIVPLDAQGLKAYLNAYSSRYDPWAHLIQHVAQDKYAWLPKLVAGAVLRHTLTSEELKKRTLFFEPELVTALWPGGIDLGHTETLVCQLSDGGQMTLAAEMVAQKHSRAVWGTRAEPAFWDWLRGQKAKAHDALTFRIEGGVRASCRIKFDRGSVREKPQIQARDTALTDAAFAFVKTHHRGVRLDDIAARLLAQGLYRDPCPPNALEVVIDRDSRFMWEQDMVRAATRADRLYQDLGLEEPDPFDFDEPQRPVRSRSRPSVKGLAEQVYHFKAAYRHKKSLWRRIEIRGDQSLRELDREMRVAFGHDTSDHLSEFYLGVDARADRRGLGHHNPFERGGGDAWKVGELGLEPGDELSYTYDFGDNIQHVLTLEDVTKPEPKVKYPRVVEQNKPRYRYCEACRQKGEKGIATWICIDCSNRKQREILVCKEHVVSDHETHDAEEIVY